MLPWQHWSLPESPLTIVFHLTEESARRSAYCAQSLLPSKIWWSVPKVLLPGTHYSYFYIISNEFRSGTKLISYRVYKQDNLSCISKYLCPFLSFSMLPSFLERIHRNICVVLRLHYTGRKGRTEWVFRSVMKTTIKHISKGFSEGCRTGR